MESVGTQSIVKKRPRIYFIDVMRGLIMLIMTLDHVRDFWNITPYSPTDLDHTSPELFFTRWITNYCAPVFVFLTGISAWLYRHSRNINSLQLSKFLLMRGLWLIFMELTVVSFGFSWGEYILLQVLWATGLSMIVLSALVFLPTTAIAGIGLVILFGHNLLDNVSCTFGAFNWLWEILHIKGVVFTVFGKRVILTYPLIPWIGLIAVGYSFGRAVQLPSERRNKLFIIIGIAAISLFILLRFLDGYGDPSPWTVQQQGAVYTLLSFLNTTKYPPSFLFLLMTLGPAILLMPLFDKLYGAAGRVLATYGHVPFFYYILHLYFIHFTSFIWIIFISHGHAINFRISRSNWPENYHPSLLRMYLVWVAVVCVLYIPCRFFMQYKKKNNQWWLSFL